MVSERADDTEIGIVDDAIRESIADFELESGIRRLRLSLEVAVIESGDNVFVSLPGKLLVTLVGLPEVRDDERFESPEDGAVPVGRNVS